MWRFFYEVKHFTLFLQLQLFFSFSKDTHKRNVIPHYEVLKLGSSCDGISQYVAFNDLTHTLWMKKLQGRKT